MKVKNICKYCHYYERGGFLGVFWWMCIGFSHKLPKYIAEDKVRAPIREFYCPYFKHKKCRSRQLRIGRHTVVEMLKNAQFVHREMQRFKKFLQNMKEKGAVL